MVLHRILVKSLRQFSQHVHTALMKPLCTKVANVKRKGKVKIAYGEPRSYFVGP